MTERALSTLLRLTAPHANLSHCNVFQLDPTLARVGRIHCWYSFNANILQKRMYSAPEQAELDETRTQ